MRVGSGNCGVLEVGFDIHDQAGEFPAVAREFVGIDVGGRELEGEVPVRVRMCGFEFVEDRSGHGQAILRGAGVHRANVAQAHPADFSGRSFPVHGGRVELVAEFGEDVGREAGQRGGLGAE